MQSFPAFFCQMVEGAAVSGFLPDKSGLCKFCKSLLELKIGGISYVQNKLGDLGI